MKGKHEVTVKNARLQYKFTVERNITILRGDSATGKTTLIDMIASYQRLGKQSGVEVRSDKALAVLTGVSWQLSLAQTHNSIVFIDEGEKFVTSKEFAEAAKASDNYFVIATRASLFNLPYSTKEIYGIKNTAGNRYQGTKRLYAEFFQLYKKLNEVSSIPDIVVVEDSNAGFEFFRNYFQRFGIECISAGGKSGVFRVLAEKNYQNALVIVDGAAFGPEIERIVALGKVKRIMLYLPESFEWLVLKSDIIDDKEVREILNEPSEHIDSAIYFSWEQFFTALLTEHSQGTYLRYTKSRLNENYLNTNEMEKIGQVMADITEILNEETNDDA
ncbi:MAG: translation initiation factor 2 [Oscillospiraceae bacterium]|nr:translation initiation factor 2 [Oscillospiraceae bacterium]